MSNHPCAHCGIIVLDPCHWRGPITSPLHKECVAADRDADAADEKLAARKEAFA